MKTATSDKSAWVQLYEARRSMGTIRTRAPGRPPLPIPRRKVGMTLSKSEVTELEVWQERFSHILNRKVSIGETVGILTRICSARFTHLSSNGSPKALDRLVENMVSSE
jgi:hypothetical protein